jgi:AraC-like DNA-binding protein
VAADWSRYWRAPGLPLEAMNAHFETTVYHRHSQAAVTAAGAPARSAVATGPARRARDLLQAEPLTDISGPQLAAAAGCSRFALHRSFVAAYGLTPAGYQRQIRLRLARRLIADGCPISDAAAASGFADQSHLTRWFVRHYAITPGAYRRATRAGRG